MSLAAVAFAALLSSQEPGPVPDNCSDNHGVDRCSEEVRARVLALFGAPRIEDEAAAGGEVYRVLQVDGAGREQFILAFEWRAGGSPRAVLYGPGGETVSGAAPLTVWERIRSASHHADEEFTWSYSRPQRPVDGVGSVVLCSHSPNYTVEMANAPHWNSDVTGPVRRRTENGCPPGLTGVFARTLAAEAIRLLPECDALDGRMFDSPEDRLELCGKLTGDRMTAARLLNQIDEWPPALGSRTSDWEGYIRNNALEPTWGGRRIEARQTADFLTTLHKDDPTLYGEVIGARGVSARQVETWGRFLRWDQDGREWNAPFRQTWVLEDGRSRWSLRSWIVDAFQPATDDGED